MLNRIGRHCSLGRRLASLKFRELEYFWHLVRQQQLGGRPPSELLIRRSEGVDPRNLFLQEEQLQATWE
jgi:hypothetical protein